MGCGDHRNPFFILLTLSSLFHFGSKNLRIDRSHRKHRCRAGFHTCPILISLYRAGIETHPRLTSNLIQETRMSQLPDRDRIYGSVMDRQDQPEGNQH